MSDRYFSTENLPISEEEYAFQLNNWLNIAYYVKQKSGEKYAYLAKQKLTTKLEDRTLLNNLERSIDETLDGRPLYIAYFDINKRTSKKGTINKFYYNQIMSLKKAHPENQYLMVLNINYLTHDKDFIELHKEGLLKIDSHGVLDKYVPYPGHFEDHWMVIDTNLNVQYAIYESGFNLFRPEADEFCICGMKCFEEETPISGEEFKKKRNTLPYLEVYSKIEEQHYGMLVFREREGQLEYESFKKQLSNSLSIHIDFTKPLVIAYFESVKGVQNIAHKYLKLNKFENQIRQNPDVNHLFILDKDYELKEKVIELSDLPVLIDRHGLIERVISRYDVKCENWIGIRPDGSYYLCYGKAEHGINLKAVREN